MVALLFAQVCGRMGRGCHGFKGRKFGMMGVMTLIARNLFLGPQSCIPEAVNPPVNPHLPVAVDHTVTFSTEEDRLILCYHTAIMIGVGVRVVGMMAIETPEIQTMGKKHVLMCTKGKV